MKKRLLQRAVPGAATLFLLAGFGADAQAQEEPAWFRRDMPVRQSGRFPAMGALPSESDVFARSPRFTVRSASRGERPRRLELTDYLPPVGSQGAQGSCVGWSTAYYNYTYCVAKQRKLSPDRIADPRFAFSPAFLYNQINGGKDGGSTISEAFRLLREKGCATLAEMPYNDKDYTTPPGDTARERAIRYQARDTGYLFSMGAADPEKLKTFLADIRQPFVMAIPIFSDFPNGATSADTVYRLTVPDGRENLQGYHAITIIGYDDEKRAFRLVNSWGQGWGDRGFLWIDEEFIRKYGMEGWSVVPGGVIARSGIRGSGLGSRLLSSRIRLEPARE